MEFLLAPFPFLLSRVPQDLRSGRLGGKGFIWCCLSGLQLLLGLCHCAACLHTSSPFGLQFCLRGGLSVLFFGFLLSTCSWRLTAQSLGESALLDRSPGNFSSRNYSSHGLSGPREMQPVPYGEGSLLFSSLPYFCPLASVSLFS